MTALDAAVARVTDELPYANHHLRTRLRFARDCSRPHRSGGSFLEALGLKERATLYADQAHHGPQTRLNLSSD